MEVSGKCILLGSVSSPQKFEATDVRDLSVSQLSGLRSYYSSQISDRLRYSSQTDQCYSSVLQLNFIQKIQENPSSRHEGMLTQRHEEKRGEPWPFGSSFCMFFLPLGLPYVNWASQECCLSYLRSSLRSSDFPLFYFHRLFPSLSFSHHHFGLLFPILTT